MSALLPATTRRVPTPEQRIIIEAAKSGESMRIYGLAGAAKTSTLRAIAYQLANSGFVIYYLAYNKAIAAAARAAFPDFVRVYTQHGLAYRSIGVHYKHRLPDEGASFLIRKAIENEFLADIIGLTWNRFMGLRTVTNTLNTFLFTSDNEVLPEHVNRMDLVEAGITGPEGRAHVAAITQRVFNLMADRTGTWPISHDVYLKLFAMANPDIGAHTVLYDEIQDANPVTLQIVKNQACQKIVVGDSNQSIYEHRKAINAFEQLDYPTYTLSQSFRFGQTIADVANRVLAAKGETVRIIGNPAKNSIIRTIPVPDVLLARTNAGLFSEALRIVELLEDNEKIAFNGGIDKAMDMVISAYHLYKHGKCDHPAFKIFGSWDELAMLAESKQAENFGPFVKLVLTHKDAIPMLCASLARRATNNEAEARVVFSTAHTYKGREAKRVRLGDDFGPFCRYNDKTDSFTFDIQEANIGYVALTRAMDELDYSAYARVLEESEANMKRMKEQERLRMPLPNVISA
jgi:hypothetical protein